MKLLYGTANMAKIRHMKEILSDLQLEIVGLGESNVFIGEIDECGDTPLENAVIKAKAYYKVFRAPVFSCDSGLYFDGIEDVDQPGVYVRRVKGKNLTDDEMIEYYSSLAQRLGGTIKARYRNAICLIMEDNRIYTYDGLDIASEEFIITSIPHQKRNNGFPLDSLSIDIKSGNYYMDLGSFTEEEKNMSLGFSNFFKKALQL